MSVTRLDGLVVTQRRIALDKYTEAGVARVQFAMRPLVLGQGYIGWRSPPSLTRRLWRLAA